MNLPHDAPQHIRTIRDESSGLEAVIAVHSTALGPAAGGCRFWSYSDSAALTREAIRLAEGMTYKNALAGLPFGGGKAVVRRPKGPFDREILFRAFGRAVEALQGQYITAEDVGTSIADMVAVARETGFVAGLPSAAGRPGGDPSPWTARGVFLAMEVAAARRLDRPLSGCTVSIQGVGHVGAALAKMLRDAGAKLVVCDVDRSAVERVAAETGAEPVAVNGILEVPADIFAPCALGGVLNEASIGRISAKVVCGAANNQLATPEDGVRLADRGVLYTPDYVVNAGGIINVAAEYLGWTSEQALERVEATGNRLSEILDHAAGNGLAPHQAADDRARAIVAAAAFRAPVDA